MTVMPRWNRLVPTAATLLVALALTPAPAGAQVVKPFKITGEGSARTASRSPARPRGCTGSSARRLT
jgi:hypothetical protein